MEIKKKEETQIERLQRELGANTDASKAWVEANADALADMPRITQQDRGAADSSNAPRYRGPNDSITADNITALCGTMKPVATLTEAAKSSAKQPANMANVLIVYPTTGHIERRRINRQLATVHASPNPYRASISRLRKGQRSATKEWQRVWKVRDQGQRIGDYASWRKVADSIVWAPTIMGLPTPVKVNEDLLRAWAKGLPMSAMLADKPDPYTQARMEEDRNKAIMQMRQSRRESQIGGSSTFIG